MGKRAKYRRQQSQVFVDSALACLHQAHPAIRLLVVRSQVFQRGDPDQAALSRIICKAVDCRLVIPDGTHAPYGSLWPAYGRKCDRERAMDSRQRPRALKSILVRRPSSPVEPQDPSAREFRVDDRFRLRRPRPVSWPTHRGASQRDFPAQSLRSSRIGFAVMLAGSDYVEAIAHRRLPVVPGRAPSAFPSPTPAECADSRNVLPRNGALSVDGPVQRSPKTIS